MILNIGIPIGDSSDSGNWVKHDITKAHLNANNEYAIPVSGRYAIYLPNGFSMTCNMSLYAPDNSFYTDSWFWGIGCTGDSPRAVGMSLGALALLMDNKTYHNIGSREDDDGYYSSSLCVYFRSNAPVLKVELSRVTLTSLSYTFYTMQL